jgi:RNA polymerase sigma factor (TIGR02999 family)
MDTHPEICEAVDHARPRVADELLPLVYDELHRLAVREMAREHPGNTLQPTALINEVYIRLLGKGEKKLWDNSGHFFAAAAEAMRRILIEKARSKQCQKRGGLLGRKDLDSIEVSLDHDGEDLIALDEALAKLKETSPRLAELVQLRFFGGLTLKEAAVVIGISPRTADSDWSYARAWLLAELSENGQ